MISWCLSAVSLCVLGLAIIDFDHVSPQLVKVNNCTCIQKYNCDVSGDGFTFWEGSAFRCPSISNPNRIVLSHASFKTDGDRQQCNNGSIVAYNLSFTDDIYTSQLSVNVNSDLIDSTIQCLYSPADGGNTINIGSITISITDPIPIPTNVHLDDVSPSQLTFKWNPVASDCLPLHYNTKSKCGVCINSTDSPSVNCSILPVNSTQRMCNFAVKSIACNDIAGNLSKTVDVMLKVPEPPLISSVIPSYHLQNGTLKALNITFMEAIAFNISRGIAGSALYYTVKVNNTDDSTCDAGSYEANVNINSCNKGFCIVVVFSGLIPLCSESSESANLMVTVTAINKLGQGLPSSYVTIGRINKYLSVKFSTTSTHITCTFLDQQDTETVTELSCNIKYGQSQEQQNRVSYGYADVSSPSTVRIPLPFTLHGSYYYTVTASDGNFTVQLIGQDVLSVRLAILIGVIIPSLVVIIVAVIVNSVIAGIIKIRLKGNSDLNTINGRLPADVVPSNYQLELIPNLDECTFEGRLKITAKVSSATNKIVLHCADLAILTLSTKKEGCDQDLTKKYSLMKNDETLCLELSSTLNVEENLILNIKYTGTINNQLRGFFHFKCNGIERFSAATMFESADARRALPCWDEPGFKATFDVVLVVPKDRVALSNMNENKSKDIPDRNLKRVTFNTTPEMSTYTLAFVVGDFECDQMDHRDAKNVPVRVYTPVGKIHQGKTALEFAKKILTFCTNYFGREYPMNKLDLIAIPDLGCVAMENWGLITVSESRLLIRSDKPSAHDKLKMALVIGHEVAQQWFGNLVTIEWWAQIWLYEGFTSWIKYLCANSADDTLDALTQFVSCEYIKAINLDGLASSHPIEVFNVSTPAEAEQLFDVITYSKGSSIFRMLQDWIGEEKFKLGLHEYLKKYELKNPTTDEFWTCMAEASEKPVAKMMSAWIKVSGYPILSVEGKQDGEDRVLTISQNKFHANEEISKSIEGSNESVLWHVPVTVATSTNRTAKKFVLEKHSDTVTVKGVGPSDWILLNPNRQGFYRVHYSSEMLTSLLKALKDELVTPEDMMGLQNDVFAMARAGMLDITEVLQLFKKFVDVTSFVVWESLIENLSVLDRLFSCTTYYEDFKRYVVNLLTPIAKKLGWDASENENQFDAALRSLVIGQLGYYGDEDIITEAKERFKSHRYGESLLQDDLKTSVYSICLANGDDTTYNDLMELHKNNHSHQERVRIYRSLGYGNTDELILKCLDFSLEEPVPPKSDTQILFSSAMNSGHGARKLVWKFMKKKWSVLKKDFAGQNTLRKIIEVTTSGFVSEKKASEIEKFFEQNPWETANRVIEQNCEIIRLDASWLKRLQRDTEKIKKCLTEDESEV